MSHLPGQCDAYVLGRSVLLARGGRRHMRCKNVAVVERTRSEGQFTGPPKDRTYRLCGTHAAMWDDPHRYYPLLSSDT